MDRGLTVMNIAYPFAPVRQDTAGGAEQVLAMIDEALVTAGHGSVVVACAGSEVFGELIPLPRLRGLIDDRMKRYVYDELRKSVSIVLQRRHIDVIHMHGLDFDSYLPPPGIPALITLHLPTSWYSKAALETRRPDTYFNCVSRSQHSACLQSAALLPAVENGVQVERLAAAVGKRNFAVSLGRICIEKGFHLAVRASKMAGTGFILAGEVFRYESHERYFMQELLPLLRASGFRFAGPVDFARKRRLLTAARCLLVPSLVPETSSLVAMEALSCGTPVIAFASGALGEIIRHGKTGFLVKDEYEMAEAINSVDVIDPAECRAAARSRFSSERMTGEYLSVYARLATARAEKVLNT